MKNLIICLMVVFLSCGTTQKKVDIKQKSQAFKAFTAGCLAMKADQNEIAVRCFELACSLSPADNTYKHAAWAARIIYADEKKQ